MSPDAPKFRIGQTVYHVADEDPGVVMGILYYADHIEYEVVWPSRVRDTHGETELSSERVYIGVRGKDDDDDKEGARL